MAELDSDLLNGRPTCLWNVDEHQRRPLGVGRLDCLECRRVWCISRLDRVQCYALASETQEERHRFAALFGSITY